MTLTRAELDEAGAHGRTVVRVRVTNTALPDSPGVFRLGVADDTEAELLIHPWDWADILHAYPSDTTHLAGLPVIIEGASPMT